MGSNGVKEKRMKECVGKVLSSTNYGDFKIIKYVSAKEVLVKFLKTGTEVWCTRKNAFEGGVKDKYFPTICGVGYYGNALPKRSHPKIERIYNVWSKMIRRCYDAEYIQFKDYSDCSVSENFTSFEYFLTWYLSQVGSDKNNWQLDKDLLTKGNRVYSEDTCCLVPPEINTLLTRYTKNSDTCKGVYYNKRLSKFSAHLLGKYIGLFTTEIEAFQAYKVAKESYIKEVANKWEEQIDIRLYNSLINWEISFDDK